MKQNNFFSMFFLWLLSLYSYRTHSFIFFRIVKKIVINYFKVGFEAGNFVKNITKNNENDTHMHADEYLAVFKL